MIGQVKGNSKRFLSECANTAQSKWRNENVSSQQSSLSPLLLPAPLAGNAYRNEMILNSCLYLTGQAVLLVSMLEAFC